MQEQECPGKHSGADRGIDIIDPDQIGLVATNSRVSNQGHGQRKEGICGGSVVAKELAPISVLTSSRFLNQLNGKVSSELS